jgi:predicted ArsR family transcriptional regulator
MKSPSWRERLLQTTRGRILALLQTEDRTVNDLTRELQTTDNAVRAHLISLERDGLVRRTGMEPGVRRPHVAYGITPETEHIFPKAYGTLLSQVVAVVARRLKPRELRASMKEVGRNLAQEHLPKLKAKTREARIAAALELLKEMGGAATFQSTADKHLIRGNGCPLAAATANHPEACLIAESLLTTVIGVPVKERCERGTTPRCCFEVGHKGKILK